MNNFSSLWTRRQFCQWLFFLLCYSQGSVSVQQLLCNSWISNSCSPWVYLRTVGIWDFHLPSASKANASKWHPSRSYRYTCGVQRTRGQAHWTQALVFLISRVWVPVGAPKQARFLNMYFVLSNICWYLLWECNFKILTNLSPLTKVMTRGTKTKAPTNFQIIIDHSILFQKKVFMCLVPLKKNYSSKLSYKYLLGEQSVIMYLLKMLIGQFISALHDGQTET